MAGQVEQRRVKLADLWVGGRRPFARLRGESPVEMRARLLTNNGLLARGKRKALAYERAMARGEAFPAPFVLALDGQLLLDDGCHRCTAAALSGAHAIDAVVIPVETHRQADAVSELLFNLEAAGASWQDRALLAAAALGCRAAVAT